MDMDTYILKRIGSAKLMGLIIGLVAFLMIPYFWPGESMWLRVGVLMWYTTVGAVVGAIGLVDHHPLLKFRLTFWFRGLVVGAWFNLVLVFLMYDKFGLLLKQMEGSLGGITSPFWIVAEGALVGLIIDAAATKYAGEGPPRVK